MKPQRKTSPSLAASSAGDDLSLMCRIRDGDADAFVVFVDRWQSQLARFFQLMGARGAEVDDGVQEVFLRVYRHRQRFDAQNENAVRAFVLRVARNTYIDQVRKKRRGPQWVELESEGLIPDPTSETGGGQDARAALDDRFDLEIAVHTLPEKLREVVVLSTWKGLSQPDIAEILSIPVGTVKSRMHYAIRQLREVFDVRTVS